MAVKSSIYKEVAETINSIALIEGINSIYDVFCSNLEISKYLSEYKIHCVDKSKIKIEILKAYRDNDIKKINELVANVINRYIAEPDKYTNKIDFEHLLNILSSIYGDIRTNEITSKSLEEMIKYHSEIHLDNMDKNEILRFINKPNVELIESDFSDLDIQGRNILICYAPYRKANIMEDRFNHKGYMKWLNEMSENNIVFVISKENPGEQFIELEELEKEKKNSKEDKDTKSKLLRLYIDKKTWDNINGTDEDVYDF